MGMSQPARHEIERLTNDSFIVARDRIVRTNEEMLIRTVAKVRLTDNSGGLRTCPDHVTAIAGVSPLPQVSRQAVHHGSMPIRESLRERNDKHAGRSLSYSRFG
jgi:hypothetical protein